MSKLKEWNVIFKLELFGKIRVQAKNRNEAIAKVQMIPIIELVPFYTFPKLSIKGSIPIKGNSTELEEDI
jgi:hypothetical protein